MALKIKVNEIATTLPEAAAVHQWTCGLEIDSDPCLLRAAEEDALRTGLVFVFAGGAEAYKAWMKKQLRKVNRFALTKISGNDNWWWEALDRTTGLILLEQGEIESSPFKCASVPGAAPVGLDYSDLFRGQMIAGGCGEMRLRQPGQSSGGRRLGV